uniref:Uncharacterized protein n=1 Tax=Oryza brachyantha TaxID=4533 RepID=J3M6R9_ORYBR
MSRHLPEAERLAEPMARLLREHVFQGGAEAEARRAKAQLDDDVREVSRLVGELWEELAVDVKRQRPTRQQQQGSPPPPPPPPSSRTSFCE